MVIKQRLYILLLIAILLKGTLLVFSEVVADDGAFFLTQANFFLRGDWDNAFAVPLNRIVYPALIALLGLIIPDLEMSGRLLSFFASILSVIPCYLLISELFDDDSALYGTAAYLFAPMINRYSVSVMREPVFLLFLFLALLYMCRFLREGRVEQLFLSIAFSVITVVFRMEGFLLFIISLSLIFLVKRNNNTIVRFNGIYIIAFIFFVIVSSLVFLRYDIQETYRFLRIDEIYNRMFLQSGGEFSDNIESIKSHVKGLKGATSVSVWDNDFFEIVHDNIRSIYLLGLVRAVMVVTFPLYFLMAVFAIFKYGELRRDHVFVIVSLVLFALFSYVHLIRVDFISYRYLFPIAILLFPWAGLCLKKAREYCSLTRFSKAIPAVLLLVFVFWPVYESFGYLEMQMVSSREAGKWLSSQDVFKNEAKIVGNDATFLYYAGMNWTSYHDLISAGYEAYSQGDWPKINEFALKDKANVIMLAFRRRKIERLPVFDDFILVKKFEDDAYIQLIYKIKTSDK